ncbi:MAG: malectin domain-containing carbohydrate-binding protein, partial [Limisphaerales bacterium]
RAPSALRGSRAQDAQKVLGGLSRALRNTTAPLLWPTLLCATALVAGQLPAAAAESPPKHYYAHPAVEDRYGVIAPWYQGQNGQCDLRVRIAAETLKRYPWADARKTLSPAPEFIYNGAWRISSEGAISIPPLRDWDNGDLGQRAAYVLSALVDYYRYSGDPAAIAIVTLQAEVLLDHCQTGPEHPWPRFLISVPTKGKPYGKCDPHGMIQLDIVAETGLGLLRAYELTGNTRWLGAAQHWADLLAQHRSRDAGRSPWNRYANPEDVAWEDHQTGGVVFILAFFDELIRLGYTGAGNRIVEARDAGQRYLRDVLLPKWTVSDTWGRNYWDWPDPVQAENVTEFAARYLIEHPRYFPNWRADARNLLSLFLNHTSVSLESRGDVFSGAWAYPESSGCCGRSLWYGPMELATVFAQYGVAADSAWSREQARRQMILATYDAHETGVVEDNIDGGQVVAGSWFKIAHPMALKHVLGAMAWLPEIFGAAGENHILRSSGVVTSVVYGRGRISYATFDAPADSVEVLRLAFRPANVTADGKRLHSLPDLKTRGYQLQSVPGGDWLVTIRHDGSRNIVVAGDDPQDIAEDGTLSFSGDWRAIHDLRESGGTARVSSTSESSAAFSFTGNQVRLLGRAAPDGGLADVDLDGARQRAVIDCWNPATRHQQVLFYQNGLQNRRHELRVVVRGARNPVSRGANVYVDAVQWSAVSRPGYCGEGGGPTNVQRLIFGYAGRADFVDSSGRSWRPATEFIIRSGSLSDSVAASWWTEPRRLAIANTRDPELYRHGVHGRDFTVYVTVGPGAYYARLKFAETSNGGPAKRPVTIRLNGREVVSGMDVAATAGGLNRAVDLVFNDLAPTNGVIAIRFIGGSDSEAMVQAVEIGPGYGGPGAKPVSLPATK